MSEVALYSIDCVRDGKVIEAANIARWTVGKSWEIVKRWYEKRGATVVVVRP